MDNVVYVKMSRLVRLRDNAFRSNPLRLKRLEDVNLAIWLCHLWIFQKWSFWRKSNALLFMTFSEDMKIFSMCFDIYLLQKKSLTSAYNTWSQQLFCFNILEIDCLIIIFISVLDYFFLDYGEAGNREWITWNCCSLISLKWVAFLRLQLWQE